MSKASMLEHPIYRHIHPGFGIILSGALETRLSEWDIAFTTFRNLADKRPADATESSTKTTQEFEALNEAYWNTVSAARAELGTERISCESTALIQNVSGNCTDTDWILNQGWPGSGVAYPPRMPSGTGLRPNPGFLCDEPIRPNADPRSSCW